VLHHAQLDKLIGVTHFNVIIRTLFVVLNQIIINQINFLPESLNSS